jgi:hypothetical protein
MKRTNNYLRLLRASASLREILLLVLPAAVVTVLVLDRPPERHGREFQALVGGLGFGPAGDLSRCAFGFDPRLCPGCPHDLGPIPGGSRFCPDHGCSILYYPPLRNAPPP